VAKPEGFGGGLDDGPDSGPFFCCGISVGWGGGFKDLLGFGDYVSETCVAKRAAEYSDYVGFRL
jgi:hypothetical protein